MKKIKLIYILPQYDAATGTHLFYLYAFIERLAAQYDVWLITLAGDDPRGHIAGVTHHSYLGGRSRLGRFIFFKLVIIAARLRGFNRVYVHYSYWAAIVASIIMRLSGGRVWYWNCGMPWLFGKQYPLRLTLLFVHTLVTGTPRMKELYHEQYAKPLDAIAVMPNWIELERFASLPSREEARRGLGLPADAPTVLFVHKLVERKGADLLPQIMEGLSADAHMVIVGGGALLEPLKREMSVRGVAERVHFTGWVPAHDIPMYMRAADVYLMPSREEGFPHTILEAMAVGTPFIATDVGGMRDIVPRSLAGELFVPAVGIASATARLLEDAPVRARIARQLRAHVAQFDLPAVIRHFLRIVI